MSSMQARRMTRELSLLKTAAPPGVAAWPREDGAGSGDGARLDELDAEIVGAAETPYAGGVFRLRVTIPPEYPLRPPAVRFLTRIYHPNIDAQGRICLDTLNMPPKGAWRPSLNVSTVLASVQLLMSHPNPDDGLMADITDEFRRAPEQFAATAKLWTARYASGSSSDPQELSEAGGSGGEPARADSPVVEETKPMATDDAENVMGALSCDLGIAEAAKGGRSKSTDSDTLLKPDFRKKLRGARAVEDASDDDDDSENADMVQPASAYKGGNRDSGVGKEARGERLTAASRLRRAPARKIVLSQENDTDHVSESSDDGAPEVHCEEKAPGAGVVGGRKGAGAARGAGARGKGSRGLHPVSPSPRRRAPAPRQDTEVVVVVDLDSDLEEKQAGGAVAAAVPQEAEKPNSGRKRRAAAQAAAPATAQEAETPSSGRKRRAAAQAATAASAQETETPSSGRKRRATAQAAAAAAVPQTQTQQTGGSRLKRRRR